MWISKQNGKQDPQLESRKKPKPMKGKLEVMNSVGYEIVSMNFIDDLRASKQPSVKGQNKFTKVHAPHIKNRSEITL